MIKKKACSKSALSDAIRTVAMAMGGFLTLTMFSGLPIMKAGNNVCHNDGGRIDFGDPA